MTDREESQPVVEEDRFLEEYERDSRSFEFIDLGQLQFKTSAEGLPVLAEISE